MKYTPHNHHIQIVYGKGRIIRLSEYDLDILKSFILKDIQRFFINVIGINFPFPSQSFD